VGEALRIKDVNKYSFWWHTLQFFERFLFLALGWEIYRKFFIYEYFSILNTGIVVLCGAVFWIIYDGLINLIAFKRSFFYVSETSRAFTEKFSQWYIKIPLMMLVFFIDVIFLNKQDHKQIVKEKKEK
jgi:hypothetical protein